MNPKPRFWDASWIHPSHDPSKCFGAFVFRRKLQADEAPASLVVRVTADQRFRLYVNGSLAAWGPARGDLLHWPYDEVDLAPWLKPGENLIHAVVWSFGAQAPMAQITAQTGFLLEGEGLNTPERWEAAPVEGYEFGHFYDHLQPTYFVTGPGELLDGRKLKPWAELGEADLAWRKVEGLWHGRPDGSTYDGPTIGKKGKEEGSGVGETSWHLVPRSIPPMVLKERQQAPQVASTETGERKPWSALTLKKGEEALLDFEELLNAFPLIQASGPGRVQIRYAEALIREDGTKGHRSDVKGKKVSGPDDVFVLGEGSAVFEPLWWRCFRYVLLVCEEGEVTVDCFRALETGYPLEDESEWSSDGERHKEIFEVALRTCRLCAGETYFDCPHYEQLQYVADTRIQAQIGRYLSRDRRLQTQAVDAFAHSLQLSGAIQSRYPTREPQVIAGFCLWWIHMLWDQHLYDPEGVKPEHLGMAQGILDWFDQTVEEQPDAAYWAYADWVHAWPGGVPPKGVRSAIQTIHAVYTKIIFAKLVGDEDLMAQAAARFHEFEEKEGGLVVDPRWDPEGTPGEQSAALRRLCQQELGLPMDPWPTEWKEGTAPASFFYKWYIHQANPAGDYEAMLDPWREMLDLGLTTFLEIPDPSRSDCHAWSSHPILGFYQRIAGVRSGAPGWSQVVVAPNPGRIREFRALTPHPRGPLRVELKDGKIEVDSPVPYRLEWQGEVIEKG